MFKSVLSIGSALILSAVVANASDLPSKKSSAAPAPAPVSSSNWTGGYVGIDGGYGTGSADINSSLVTLEFFGADTFETMSLDGWLVGGKVGYDVQLQNNIVLGLVADYSRSNLSGSICVENSGCDVPSPDDSYANGKINQFATARARVGYAVDNLLIYATGGLAYADTEASISYVTSDPDSGISASAKVWGWTIGGGAEMKLTNNISIGAEYLYANFGKVNYDFAGEITGGFAVPIAVDVSESVFRTSLNYRF